jgi:hypothetical protein
MILCYKSHISTMYFLHICMIFGQFVQNCDLIAILSLIFHAFFTINKSHIAQISKGLQIKIRIN